MVASRSRQLAVVLPQHPYEHRPQRPVLLAVDQQFGEGARLQVPPELADPVGPLEVREHQDVEQLGGLKRARERETVWRTPRFWS